jgi:hypothetical protein
MYGLTWADFYALAERGQVPPNTDGFHRHTWASFYRDVRRLRVDDFADHAERVLARV